MTLNHLRRTLTVTVLASLALAGCGGGAAPPTTPPSSAPTSEAPSSSSSPAPAVPAAPEVDGMVVHASEYDVAETAERVSAALEEAGMVVATVDHAAGAASVGQQLRPTTLVIGGAPMAGTPLMLEQQRAGVDLPQKYLAWEDEDGEVFLGYNSADYIAARAGIAPDSDALATARMGSAGVAATASGNAEPLSEGAEQVTSEGYLVEATSDTTVAEAIARYETAFAAKDLMLVGTVDHAAGAASVDAMLRPTSTTFVGNPMVGTKLLQASQTFGIDLPVRYVAWEDADGVVHVAHPDIRVLAERHGATGVDEVLAMVETATGAFTDTAAGS
ncbi:MAG: DUF302 domain-containing protein [Acidimicrobiales bacterium]